MQINTYKLISDIRRIAAENPGFVYNRGQCAYFDSDGAPSCIVGQALAKQGIKPYHLEDTQNNYRVPVLLEEWCVEMPESHLWWLSNIQTYQDERKPWGVAVLAANEIFGCYDELAEL